MIYDLGPVNFMTILRSTERSVKLPKVKLAPCSSNLDKPKFLTINPVRVRGKNMLCKV